MNKLFYKATLEHEEILQTYKNSFKPKFSLILTEEFGTLNLKMAPVLLLVNISINMNKTVRKWGIPLDKLNFLLLATLYFLRYFLH